MTDYTKHIQDYVDGLLKGEDLVAFETALEADKTLREEVERQKMIQEVLTRHQQSAEQADQLRTLLAGKRSQFVTTRTKPAKGKIRYLKTWGLGLAIAASLAFIMMITGLFKTTDFGQLPDMPNYTTRGSQSNQLYELARQSFNQHRYTDAVAQLHQLHHQQKTVALYTYYLGLSYIGTKEYQQAVKYLEPIAQGQSVYKTQALYYLGYSYYRMQQPEQAVKTLRQIPSTAPRYKNAQTLLQKIK